jgi:fucose permease
MDRIDSINLSEVLPPTPPEGSVRKPRTAASPQAEQVRIHLLGLYGLLGLTLASWLARIPTVLTTLDLTTGELGVVLLVGSLGSFAMVLFAGGLTARWGERRALLVSTWGFAASAVLLAAGLTIRSVAVLTAGVTAMTASFALGSVPMNVQAVVVERRRGRTTVPQFHAAFSVGAAVGSGIGALAAWSEVSLPVQVLVVGIGGLIWRLRSIPFSVLPPLDADGGQARGTTGFREAMRAWRDRRTLILALVVMAGALSEGTANNWLAVGCVDGLGSTEAIGAALFTAFVVAMTISRLAGTWLVDTLGRVRVLIASSALAVLGLGAFALAPGLVGAAIGSAAWGLGTGLVIPIAMGAATGIGPGAAGRVGVVSAFASVASLVAPPVVGLAAEQIGLRHAMLGIAVVMVVGVVLARYADASPSDRLGGSGVADHDEPDLIDEPVVGETRAV